MIELKINQDITSNKLNHAFTFNVPDNVSSVSFQIETEQALWLTYMVYDEKKELRAQYVRGKTPQPVTVHIEREKTSANTISGPVKAGEWTMDFAVITKDDVTALTDWATCTILFDAELETAVVGDLYPWQDGETASFQLNVYDKELIFNAEKSWYKGDFHTHTIYTDGKMTREENMQSAVSQKLDFFVATDHNIVPTSWFDETDILVIPGVEVTAPLGHFNIISTLTSPFAKQRLADMETEEGMNKIINHHYGDDSIISINHPFLTEWKWLLKETPLDKVDTIEICNDPTYSFNKKATEFALMAWNKLLNDGYQITGVGGSDSHLRPDETYDGSDIPSLIGDPGTFVYCDKLTAANVVKALKKGNVTVSRGERVQFRIDDLISGEHCPQNIGVATAFVETDEAIYFEWVIDGEIVAREDGNRSEYAYDFSNDLAYHWVRVDVRYADGSFYGFSNPIYFGEKQPTMKKWGELLELVEDKIND
ncbi:CehA/McbA family metallohydrolase [Oceanobacillus chungangensis]|uniref:Polymerase/histidinol phosphatase N-terminal domain-containing protein n=1 Tax=Oceanobacillus chungangensis TaxID=1229152 RepID=A0A3D8PIX8_9BACI|nr:CehA/McbA family metallohydrolase [Oceanobacillus chungangensis]RDW15437.1 hypothetical protein CWR45_16770 [Oceanobacillus chungangensis]